VAPPRARELALQYLYERDLLGPEETEGLDGFLAVFAEPDEDIRPFARTLIEGVLARADELDEQIREFAENWRIERMAVVDRNILRLGAWEILHLPETPPKVAIDEAIELAKRFSTAESGSFVNGILDKILAGGVAPAAGAGEGAAAEPSGEV